MGESLTLDARAFLEALPAAFKELKLEAIAIEREKAERIRDAARQYAPVAEGQVPQGETPGELRDSIEVTEGEEGGNPYVEVGTSVSYAVYVEFGTSRQAARHFLLPAIAQEI